jgi:hypothetical protein
MARFLLLLDSCGFVNVERSLWLEDGSVVYNCCWSSPAQSFSGPSPVELVAIFYCLRFETSLFVASYDAQGYGGGIRPRPHTGMNSVSKSWVSHPLESFADWRENTFLKGWVYPFTKTSPLTRNIYLLLWVYVFAYVTTMETPMSVA